MHTVSSMSGLLLATAMAVGAPAVIAQATTTDPARIFAGCDDRERAPPQNATAETGNGAATSPATPVDRITQRRFASFSLNDLERGVPEDMASLCWARLDGVWRELESIVLDSQAGRAYATAWAGDNPDGVNMAHGKYTTPAHLVVAQSRDPSQMIYLSTGLDRTPFVRFNSRDNLTLEDVLRRGGPRKVYQAEGSFAWGNQLVIDVTRTGRVRLTLGQRQFVRPQAGVSEATMANQPPSNDAFLMNANVQGLAASRKGYDILHQDPFYLLQNPKREVFAQLDPQRYFISEARVVPIGFTLLLEGVQGMVYRKELVASETSLQETTSTTFGVDVKSITPPGVPPNSIGFSSTKAASRSMSESQSVAEAVAFSRHKSFALVVDHPFVTLSDEFIDAVEDARRLNRYQALIDQFGTHYPYAVTYGAAAKMTQRFSETSYATRISEQSEFAVQGGAKVFGVHASGHYSQMNGRQTGNSGTIGNEGATFQAVGGNGSWNESGYSANLAAPYPILLDLRPIHELLNPMNFPGEPEVYVKVRKNLERAVAAYITRQAVPLDARSRLTGIQPIAPPKAEPQQVWSVYVREIWCTGVGSGRVKGVRSLDLSINSGDTGTTKTGGLDVPCKFKDERKKLSYADGDPGLLTIRGSVTEIGKAIADFEMAWEYHQGPGDKGKRRTSSKRVALGEFASKVEVGGRHDEIWIVTTDLLPKFHLRLRFKRIR